MKLNASNIKLRLGLNEGGRVQQYAVKRAKDYMDKYVPYRDGFLRANVELGKNYVKYNSPYAHYMYRGLAYVDSETGSAYAKAGNTKVPSGKALNYHTPGTGSHWDKRMMSAEGKQFIKEIEEYVKRG